METRAAHHQLEELSVLTQRAVASTEATATELARVSHNVTDLRIRLDDIEQRTAHSRIALPPIDNPVYSSSVQ